MGSKAPSKDLHPLTKRQRAGLTRPHAWAKGKTPAKCSKQLSGPELSPPVISSEEDETYPPTMDVIDKWRADASESDGEDEWQDLHAD
ncbi:Hypothetical predicted protein [Pelobates cultripes]|uniref:Uncharacterized protein n=1 Tax=Pelobates cultripes TaxID=61616 RepID=A0AAD1SAM1_PELCU|nr:Hypothetical predicted protein [Pelobates cultripes]